jgi:alpha-tubulin suppressor-like RCC1 family protein
VTTGGAAYCWGDNTYGQIGDGSQTSRPSPVAVAGGFTFASLSTFVNHTCGVTAGGRAYCWGYNINGQLGDGTMTNRSAPVAVTGNLSFVAVSGGLYHTCGVTTGGAAYCWGANSFGQLGIGAVDQALHTAPVAVGGGLTFASVSAGYYHTCGVTTGGVAYCWGDNTSGQLGTAAAAFNSAVPVAVAGQASP